MEYLKDFGSEALLILTEMGPWLMLGFLFAGVLYLLFPKKRVKQYMGRDSRGAVVNASLLGIPLPLCSCGVIPTGLSFYRNGASRGSTVSFLISTPQTGVDSILVTYSLLGLPFAIIRPFVALFTGIAGGLLTNRFDKTDEDQENRKTEEKPLPPTIRGKIREMFRYAFVEFLQDISTWLIIGILAAAIISVAIPDDFFTGKVNSDLLEMLIILVASIPVYICATASVPIAAVLLLKGISPGAALVLLMAGPATNMATITMIARVLGKKSLASYLFSIISGALIAGFIINRLPYEWFSGENISLHAHHHSHLLPAWLRYGSAILLTIFIINGYIQKIISARIDNYSTKNIDTAMSDIKVFNVEGMTCNHCKSAVEKGAVSVEGVDSAVADLLTGKLTVRGESFDTDQIEKEIRLLGYRVIS
jgi:uncharacterized membrane protein YraQ (UPF0718 family)/copper chaperone CopZ